VTGLFSVLMVSLTREGQDSIQNTTARNLAPRSEFVWQVIACYIDCRALSHESR